MDNLISDLQKTIEALEALSGGASSDEVDELLDPLFQQKIDLLNATPNASSLPYRQAAQAVSKASVAATSAAKQNQFPPEASRAVAEAIAKLAKLLDSLAPIS